MAEPRNNFRPVIGITMDVVEKEGRVKVDCSLAYGTCVERAGGVAVMLPPILSLVEEHLRLCDGFILTGGDDPRMEPFGVPTHPQARVIHPIRQGYELALLEALRGARAEAPVLGVCLGMQLMALHSGGTLNQYLPDTLASHALHKNAEHEVNADKGAAVVGSGLVWSNHRQAVEDAGTLSVVARSPDGVIEAVSDPKRRWFVGVQWHPECTTDARVGQRILNDLVSAASH